MKEIRFEVCYGYNSDFYTKEEYKKKINQYLNSDYRYLLELAENGTKLVTIINKLFSAFFPGDLRREVKVEEINVYGRTTRQPKIEKEIKDFMQNEYITKAGAVLDKLLKEHEFKQEEKNEALAMLENPFSKKNEQQAAKRWANLMVATLIKNGANPNAILHFQKPYIKYTATPLHYFIENGQIFEAEALLKNGGAESLNIKQLSDDKSDTYWRYPVMLAITQAKETKDFSLVEKICEIEPSVLKQTDEFGNTGIFYAGEDLGVAKSLQKLGFDINHQNNKGNTMPMDLISYQTQQNKPLKNVEEFVSEMVEKFSKDIDWKLKNKNGDTILTLINNHFKVAQEELKKEQEELQNRQDSCIANIKKNTDVKED